MQQFHWNNSILDFQEEASLGMMEVASMVAKDTCTFMAKNPNTLKPSIRMKAGVFSRYFVEILTCG